MGIPFGQAARIGAYVVKQHLMGRKRYPLVLMLEPLFRCNLACAGCGKIDYPDEILNQRLTYEQCMQAIDECGAPAVSIAGGEPLDNRRGACSVSWRLANHVVSDSNPMASSRWPVTMMGCSFCVTVSAPNTPCKQ